MCGDFFSTSSSEDLLLPKPKQAKLDVKSSKVQAFSKAKPGNKVAAKLKPAAENRKSTIKQISASQPIGLFANVSYTVTSLYVIGIRLKHLQAAGILNIIYCLSS